MGWFRPSRRSLFPSASDSCQRLAQRASVAPSAPPSQACGVAVTGGSEASTSITKTPVSVRMTSGRMRKISVPGFIAGPPSRMALETDVLEAIAAEPLRSGGPLRVSIVLIQNDGASPLPASARPVAIGPPVRQSADRRQASTEANCALRSVEQPLHQPEHVSRTRITPSVAATAQPLLTPENVLERIRNSPTKPFSIGKPDHRERD